MKNKLLIKLYVPAIDCEYEIFIPVNETIDKVTNLIIRCVEELSDVNISQSCIHSLLDPESSSVYSSSAIVRDTNIVNGKKVILL